MTFRLGVCRAYWRFVVLFVVMTAAIVRFSGRPSADAALMAAYAFSEGSGATAADASANANDAVLTGAAWEPAGRFGHSVLLDDDDVLTVSDSPSLDLTSAFTLEAWVFPTASTPAGKIVHKLGSTTPPYSLGFSVGSPRVQITTSGGSQTLVSGFAVSPGIWTHLAATYDGATIRLYVNGVEEDAWAVSGALVTSSSALLIGSDGGGGRFAGRIDELRIHNRALTAAEVKGEMSLPVDPTFPLQVGLRTPAAGALGVTNLPVSATFTRAMDANTITTSTFTLQQVGGPAVSITPSYDAATRAATLTLNDPLSAGTDYLATVVGGSAGVKDALGNEMSASTSWTFRTGTGGAELRLAWAFSENSGSTVADATGNGNVGTLVNGPAWTAGRYGSGVMLDGVNDSVMAAASDSLDLTTGFTLEAWVYPTSGVPYGKILDKTSRTGSSYRLAISADGKPSIVFTTASGQQQTLTATRILLSQQWTHLAATYDGVDVRLYVNGIEEQMWAAGRRRVALDAAAVGGQQRHGHVVHGNPRRGPHLRAHPVALRSGGGPDGPGRRAAAAHRDDAHAAR